MREFLEDAHEHRDDGYGRAQGHAKRQMPKRFYKEVSIAPVDDGFSVLLDGRATKTPGKVTFVVPSKALAQDVVAEWEAQGEFVDTMTMPLVRLLNSALEGGEEVAPALRDEIVKFAGNDLLLYRADSPKELVADQEKHWDKSLASVARHFDVKFQPTIGITHQAQPENTLEKMAEAVAGIDLLSLTSLVSVTGLTGSGLLAIGLHHQLFDADDVWTVAHVDEDFNARLWGADDEAKARRVKRRVEFDAAVRVLGCLAG